MGDPCRLVVAKAENPLAGLQGSSITSKRVDFFIGPRRSEIKWNSWAEGKDMRFVIIGGNATGMSAASRAKRKNPEIEVSVLEQTPDVSFSA